MPDLTREERELLAKKLAETLMLNHMNVACQTTIQNGIANITCVNSVPRFRAIILRCLNEYKVIPNCRSELALASEK